MSNQASWTETVDTDVLQAIYFAQRYPMDFEKIMKDRLDDKGLKDLHNEEVKASVRQTLHLNTESVVERVEKIKKTTTRKFSKLAADILAVPSKLMK